MPRSAPFVGTFAPQAAAIADARRFVCGALASLGIERWPGDMIATELATNAVCHAGTPFTVRVSLPEAEAVAVQIEVDDGDPRLPVVNPDMPGPQAERGRGLQIVGALARTWGAYTDGSGKTVWCEFPLVEGGEGGGA